MELSTQAYSQGVQVICDAWTTFVGRSIDNTSTLLCKWSYLSLLSMVLVWTWHLLQGPLDFDYIPSLCELVIIMNLIMFILLVQSCLFSLVLFVLIFFYCLCSSFLDCVHHLLVDLCLFLQVVKRACYCTPCILIFFLVSWSICACHFNCGLGVYYCNKPPLSPPLLCGSLVQPCYNMFFTNDWTFFLALATTCANVVMPRLTHMYPKG
jgi:hypothetical protein